MANKEIPLTVSPAALDVVLETRSLEEDPERSALAVSVSGATMTEFIYELEIVHLDNVAADSAVYTQGEHDELSVVVPKDSAEVLNGAELDIAQGTTNGLVIRNPNKPDPLFGKELNLEGSLADQAKQVLNEAINPALASHGGFAELVGVSDENIAFVTMGGGCQGCAASAMTLQDGIKTMLMDALGELVDVVDSTDHSAGENPFYT